MTMFRVETTGNHMTELIGDLSAPFFNHDDAVQAMANALERVRRASRALCQTSLCKGKRTAGCWGCNLADEVQKYLDPDRADGYGFWELADRGDREIDFDSTEAQLRVKLFARGR